MKPWLKTSILRMLSLVGKDTCGKILFYHDIHKGTKYVSSSTPLDLFERQMQCAMGMGYRPSDGLPVADKTFSICLDDGYRGVLECKETLDKYSIKPVVYMPIVHIGKADYLSESEMRELIKEGWRFESHTWNHAWLPDCDTVQLKHELCDSKKYLEDLLQKAVGQICFPRGLFSKRVIDYSRVAGYSYLISSIPGSMKDRLPFSLTPRNLVQSAETVDFALILSGALRPLQSHYYRRQFRQ